MGDPKLLTPYQPFCDLRLHFPDHRAATEYHRELRLNDAIAGDNLQSRLDRIPA